MPSRRPILPDIPSSSTDDDGDERDPFCQGAALLLWRPAPGAPAPVLGHASRATPPPRHLIAAAAP
eukprot:3801544-Pyramimonas_sp.AAC.1